MLGELVTYLASVSKWVDSYLPDSTGLSEDVASTSLRIVGGSALILFVLMAISVLDRGKTEKIKQVLFVMMATVIVGSSLMLATSTVYLYANSDSAGLTNRQAGLEFWVCGNEINLIDPSGISNRVGSSTLFERNDKLVHVEDVVETEVADASLGKFMSVVGGAVVDDALVIPVNPDGSIYSTVQDGDGPSSPDPSEADKFLALSGTSRYIKTLDGQQCQGQDALVQVFVYSYDSETNTYEQTKLDNPRDYVFRNETTVPPGDCVIVEFDGFKQKTDKLCQEYGEIDSARCTDFGVMPENKDSCIAEQINYSPIGTGADPNASKEVNQ